MSDAKYDVVGIGNAIVDVLAHAEDKFLEQHGLAKGAMTIINAETADKLYGLMGSGVKMSGGSAANTIAGIASLGGAGAFIGKVCQDELGDVFTHDIRAAGVFFNSAPNSKGLKKTGVAKVESTPKRMLCFFAIFPTASKSVIFKSGFVGVSIQINFVLV